MPLKHYQSKPQLEEQFATLNDQFQAFPTQTEEMQNQVALISPMKNTLTQLATMVEGIQLQLTQAMKHSEQETGKSKNSTNKGPYQYNSPKSTLNLQSTNPMSSVKPPKLSLPPFDGSNPLDWIFQAELYFNYYQLPPEDQLSTISFYMQGQALSWFMWMYNNRQLTTWDAFVRALEMRFGPSSYDNHRAALFKLRQTVVDEEEQSYIQHPELPQSVPHNQAQCHTTTDSEFYLSLATYFGLSSPKTLRVSGEIQGQVYSMLIDSGSTHNIMQPRVISFLGLPIVVVPNFQISSMVLRWTLGVFVMPFGLSNGPSTFQASMNDLSREVLRHFVLVFFDDILIYSATLKEHVEHLRQGESVPSEHSVFLGAKPFRGNRYCQPVAYLLKSQQFRWNERADGAFKELKDAMTQVHVLALPDFTATFELITDASGTAIGAVLLQSDHPISHFSKKLVPRMQVASAYVRELFALTEAVKKFRQYLLGRNFFIFTDQRSLKYLLSQSVTPEQHKWLTKLMGYDYEIIYKHGKENKVADALSPVQTCSYAAITAPEFTWLSALREYFATEPKGMDFIHKVKSDLISGFTINDKLIYFNRRLYIPAKADLRQQLLAEYHTSPLGRHLGNRATLAHLASSFFCLTMSKDVHMSDTQILHSKTIWPSSISTNSLTSLGRPKHGLHHQSSSFNRQNHHLVKFISSMAFLKPSSRTETLFSYLNFRRNCFVSLAPNSTTAAPTTLILMAKQSLHSSIQMSPFQALYGRPPPTVPFYIISTSKNASIDATLTHRDQLLSELKQALRHSQQAMMQQTNKKRQDVKFEEGELVYIKLQPNVSYEIDLPATSRIHNIFHISHLRRCLNNPPEPTFLIPATDEDDKPIVTPEKISDWRQLWSNGISKEQCLIQWSNTALTDCTWEDVEELRCSHPSLFSDTVPSGSVGMDDSSLVDKAKVMEGGIVKRAQHKPFWAKDYVPK
ncbi:hypothetical protein F3Y22_tig00110500pilonHSYRG00129 [Hibiscus syriacus]|uniref:Reverse transcriptase n=1 Tax=Hibiscus syriacus TaxID=106335 RepID=A0A6A3AEC1_HIBSY|nr:hypothetical protein F3Y22_tig00110500pilonHSYRG00129 [Hibiscus syriacus]